MKKCPVCSNEFSPSMSFCLEDGTVLVDSEQEATLVIAGEMGLYSPQEEDAEEQQLRLLQELFQTNDFAELRFDARFDRLLERLRKWDYYLCTAFLIRLVGRSMLAERRGISNADVNLLWNILNEGSPQAVDQILTEAGLI